MRSKRSSSSGSNRLPRTARSPVPLSSAFSRAAATARRERSTAVTRPAPARAAATATAPLPVHRSRTEQPGRTSARVASASIHESERGRNTPGGARTRTTPTFPARPRRKPMSLDQTSPTAAELEITVGPVSTVPEAMAQLAAGRRMLGDTAAGRARPACAGVHPFAAPDGLLNEGKRYERTLADYGPAARQQLVCALQVHVAVGGPSRALAVYNALRSYLPELIALTANAPWHAGRDTGLASIRPKLAEALPRQGVPPAISSWAALAGELHWGNSSGTVPEPGRWWWELRPHPSFGTLELRVPDAQTTLAHASGVAAFAHALVGWLTARHDAGEALPVADS